jgi:hypothetical protein
MGDAARAAFRCPTRGEQATAGDCAETRSLPATLAVVAMISLIIIAAAVVIVVVGLLLGAYQPAARGAGRYRAEVDLHGIRRRQEVAQFKSEVKRDATQARRELREELGGLRRQESDS